MVRRGAGANTDSRQTNLAACSSRQAQPLPSLNSANTKPKVCGDFLPARQKHGRQFYRSSPKIGDAQRLVELQDALVVLARILFIRDEEVYLVGYSFRSQLRGHWLLRCNLLTLYARHGGNSWQQDHLAQTNFGEFLACYAAPLGWWLSDRLTSHSAHEGDMRKVESNHLFQSCYRSISRRTRFSGWRRMQFGVVQRMPAYQVVDVPISSELCTGHLARCSSRSFLCAPCYLAFTSIYSRHRLDVQHLTAQL